MPICVTPLVTGAPLDAVWLRLSGDCLSDKRSCVCLGYAQDRRIQTGPARVHAVVRGEIPGSVIPGEAAFERTQDFPDWYRPTIDTSGGHLYEFAWKHDTPLAVGARSVDHDAIGWTSRADRACQRRSNATDSQIEASNSSISGTISNAVVTGSTPGSATARAAIAT